MLCNLKQGQVFLPSAVAIGGDSNDDDNIEFYHYHCNNPFIGLLLAIDYLIKIHLYFCEGLGLDIDCFSINGESLSAPGRRRSALAVVSLGDCKVV